MNRWQAAALVIICASAGLLLSQESAQAAFATSDKVATASVSQELTLTILPAVEATVISSSAPEQEANGISQQFTLGVRANTGWAIETSITSTAYYQGTCQTSNSAGERNQNDSFQLINVDCQQPISWADQPATVDLNWQVTPAVGGGLSD